MSSNALVMMMHIHQTEMLFLFSQPIIITSSHQLKVITNIIPVIFSADIAQLELEDNTCFVDYMYRKQFSLKDLF